MHVEILKWIYKGIRGVQNLEIQVTKNQNPYHTSLIMMPNGTGKTTTITLLRAIFDGTAEKWNEEMVRDFNPGTLNVKFGKFTVQLRIDEEIYWVELQLDYMLGKASYKTSRAGKSGGLESGHHLPEMVKHVFTKEFVKRFIFDGELANSILKSNSDEAERAIKYLYHLNRLDETRKKIEEIVLEQQKHNEKTTTKTEQGLSKLRSNYDSYVATKNLLEKRIEEKQQKLTRSQQDYKETIEQISLFENDNEELIYLSKKMEKEKNDSHIEVKDKTTRLLEDFRNPNFLSSTIANRLTSLSDRMQQLKLPKTMSRQFFEELAEQDHCICGRTIEEEQKFTIKNNAQDYLAEDQIGVINAIKSAVRDRHFNPILNKEIANLKDAIRLRNKVKNDWERLQIKKEEMGSDELRELLEQKRTVEKTIDSLQAEIKLLTTKDQKMIMLNNLRHFENITVCEKRLKEAKAKLAEATNTLKLLKGADRVKSYLEQIQNHALNKLKSKIKDETNEKLSQIIQIEKIQVQEIDRHLVLRNKKGTSVGQSLAIAYSYLGSLFHESTHQLPFVVDSPAGALDLHVRREVSKILPDLFGQLIIFITSGEREGFTEHFYELGENVQFLTVSKTSSEVKCLEGRKYFQTFQESKSE